MAEKKTNKKKMEKVVAAGNNLRISFKYSVEACNFVRGKSLETAMMHLQRVADKKMAIPVKRYVRDRAHKPGAIAGGIYPEKISKAFLNLLNTLKANAEDQGFNVKDLVIIKAVANKGPGRWKHSRLRGRQMKSTHVEFEAKEGGTVKK